MKISACNVEEEEEEEEEVLSVKCYIFRLPAMHITYNKVTTMTREAPGHI